MDLTFFVDLKNEAVIGAVQQQIGLYIVNQKLLPRQFADIRRCGAAGTKEVVDAVDPTKQQSSSAVKTSSFRGRVGMYLSNWITDGLIHACLTVERSINLGFSKKVRRSAQDARDARPGYAQASQTQLQVREHEYHDNLTKLGLVNVRGLRNEWYKGDLNKMKQALRKIGIGTFYDFSKGNVTPYKEKLVTGTRLETFEFDHRRSPRLEEVAFNKKDFETLNAGGRRGKMLAAKALNAGRTRRGGREYADEEMMTNQETIDKLWQEAKTKKQKDKARKVARALYSLQ